MDTSKFKDPAFWNAMSSQLGNMAWAGVRPVGDIGAPMAQYQQGVQAKATENKTLQWLQQNDPEAYQYAQAGMPVSDVMKYAMQKRAEAAKPKNNWISVGDGRLFNKDTQQFMTAPADPNAAQTEYGLTPQTGVDENGNPVFIQVGKDGKAVKTALPHGVTISKEPIKLDAGTKYILLDPITRQAVGEIPKDLAGAEAEKAKGKLTGEAVQALPATLAKADQAIATIDKALQHPGRETATGASGTWDPRNYLPGTNARDFLEVNKQLKGQTFLEAYQSLKGGGQITEVEGAKAEAAIARLETAQSDEAYAQALIELRQIIMNGRERAKQMAGQQPSATTTDPTVEDLVNKYGN